MFLENYSDPWMQKGGKVQGKVKAQVDKYDGSDAMVDRSFAVPDKSLKAKVGDTFFQKFKFKVEEEGR